MKVSEVMAYLLLGMILAAGILFFVEDNAWAEEVTLTTYYPAPYGVYNDLVVMNSLGIGTTSPGNKLEVEGGSANWSESTPGTAIGSIHLDPGVTTDHYGSAITWGASDSGGGDTGQAGIYVRSDGTYGTKMYFGTTNSYATGSQIRMMINHAGNVGIGMTGPSEKLDVAGHALATPIMGSWRAGASEAGAGDWLWGTQLYNTNSSYFTRDTDNRAIIIGVAGYYSVHASILQYALSDGERGDVYIRKNGGATTLERSLGTGNSGSQYYKHTLTYVGYFAANDKVEVYNSSAGASRYGGAWSQLHIYRLN